MKKKWQLFLFFSLLLTSCAISPQKAAMMTDYDLCKGYTNPFYDQNNKRVLWGEIMKRGIKCDIATYNAINQQQLYNNLMLMEMGRRLQEPSYIPTPPPVPSPSIDCTTWQDMYGNYHTSCR